MAAGLALSRKCLLATLAAAKYRHRVAAMSNSGDELRLMDNILKCSFCNKEQREVELLIGGPGGLYICSECVGRCNEVIESARRQQRTGFPGDLR